MGRQRTGHRDVVGEPRAPAVGVGVGCGVVVRDDRSSRRGEHHVGELGGEADAGVAHQRGVERAADIERRRALHADFLGAGGRGVDAVGGSRDHDLPGGVVVGDPAGVGCGGAGRVGLFDGGAQQRGHAAGMRGRRRPA